MQRTVVNAEIPLQVITFSSVSEIDLFKTSSGSIDIPLKLDSLGMELERFSFSCIFVESDEFLLFERFG